jgi:hypothetical protein
MVRLNLAFRPLTEFEPCAPFLRLCAVTYKLHSYLLNMRIFLLLNIFDNHVLFFRTLMLKCPSTNICMYVQKKQITYICVHKEGFV